MHILLVEDDEVDRIAIVRALGAEYEVVGACDLESGLRALSEREFACVLLDYNLPDGNGLDFVHRVRAAKNETPIILLTGQEDEQSAVDLIKAGASDFLSKHVFTPARLRLSIRLASERKTLEEDRQLLLAREQAARELAERANHAKDEFLALVSHELRTPLSAILGWTHLLRSGDLDPESAKRAPEIIERSARAQAQLVEDLLDVSRIISGKLRLHRRGFEPGAVVQGALDVIRPAVEAKSIELVAHLESVPSIVGDPDRLQQVVWNILANAVKFTPAEGRIKVEMGERSGRIFLSVSDSGRGIAPETLTSIFEAFRQEDRTPSGGLGLGLTIARHIVEQHGGRIQAFSDGLGRGSTFTVELPALPVPDSVEPVTVNGDSGRLDGVSVLVVDDDPATRDMLLTLLGCRGATVRVAASVREAIDAIEAELPTVLLSDIEMPGEDGYALIRSLRLGRIAGAANLPAIALTASTGAEHRTRILSAGFQMHAPKPVEPTHLVSLIIAVSGLPAPA